MERTYIMEKDKLIIGTDLWLIFLKIDGYSYLIKLNTNKTIIKKFENQEIMERIESKEILLDLSSENTNKVIDVNSLSKSTREKYEKAEKIFQSLEENYKYSDWLLVAKEKKYIIDSVAKQYNISSDTLRRYLRIYLQSGMSMTALIAQYSNCGVKERKYTDKKPGRKGISRIVRDENLEQILSIMTSRFVLSGAKMSYNRLYEDMINEFYTEKKYIGDEMIRIPAPYMMRPTLGQLKRWIKCHTDPTLLKIKREGKKVVRNNFRPLFSDTIAHLDVKSIGSRYEMDEVETDYCLVNRLNRNRPIGRAIVYFIVDVYSRAIVACGIGLDNNSWSGAELALINLIEDKKDYCAKYGIDIAEDTWPMKSSLPSSIMVDNGAEYLSNNFSNLAKEVGLGIDYVPPQMGSFKGNVEQKFRQLNLQLKDCVPGFIEKGKYGQPHLKKARLDIFQFSQIVIRFILNYNNSPIMNYPDSKDMFEKDFIYTPVNIWNYCLSKNNELRYVSNIESYKYSLLKRDMGSITRNGIEYKGRYFVCNDIDWLSRESSNLAISGKRNKKLPIRFDIRFPDVIYFETNGYWNKAFLNCNDVLNEHYLDIQVDVGSKTSNSKYAGLTELEIQDILKVKKQRKLNDEDIRLQNNINTKNEIKKIVNEATKIHSGTNHINNISISRREEKELLHQKEHISILEHTPENVEAKYDNQSDTVYENVDFSNMTRMEKFRWIENNKIVD